MSWSPSLREDIVDLFESLSVFDVWTRTEMWRVDYTDSDYERAYNREYQRTYQRERARKRRRLEGVPERIKTRLEQRRERCTRAAQLHREGHSYSSIARLMCVSQGTAFNLVKRGLA